MAIYMYVGTGVLLDIVHSPQPPPTEPPLLAVKECLINLRQHEGFIKVLMVENLFCSNPLSPSHPSQSPFFYSSLIAYLVVISIFFLSWPHIFFFQQDVVRCAEHVEQLEAEFVTRMQQLKDVVQAKTAVPTAQVYVCTRSWK